MINTANYVLMICFLLCNFWSERSLAIFFTKGFTRELANEDIKSPIEKILFSSRERFFCQEFNFTTEQTGLTFFKRNTSHLNIYQIPCSRWYTIC